MKIISNNKHEGNPEGAPLGDGWAWSRRRRASRRERSGDFPLEEINRVDLDGIARAIIIYKFL